MPERWSKTFAVVLTAVCFLNLPPYNAAAAQKEYLINETFAEEAGQKPSGWILKESGGAISIGSAAGTTQDSNALNLSDTDKNGSSGVAAMLRFSPQKRTTAFETRFKFDKQMGDLSFVIGGGSAEAIRITAGMDGIFTSTAGNGTRQYTKSTAKLNNWNSIRIVINPNKGTADVRINQELVTGLSTKEDCSSSGLDYLLFKTEKGTPNIFVDFVTVETGDNLNAQIQPIQAPIVEDPKPRPVPDRINVNYNGEYIYFDYPPIMINDRVMLPLRKIFEFFTMQVDWNQETSTAIISNESCKIEVTENSATAKVNGNEKKLDAPAPVINGRMYVPVRFIAESIGAQVDWDNENQTVIIRR